MPSHSAKITQIASALGVPVEALLDPASSGSGSDLGEAHELLRLWLLIRSADDRRKVLEAIREVVEAQPKVP